MVGIRMRCLGDGVKTRLRKRTAGSDRSMVDEVLPFVRDAVVRDVVPA